MEPTDAEEEEALSFLENLYINGQEEEEEDEEEAAQSEPLPNLEEVEEILGYKFNKPSLLEEAFTHLSYAKKYTSYERLEYVGDSVLNLLITREQFFAYPDLPPGALTRLRAANVDTEKLARVAVKLGLHRFLRHKKPLLGNQIQEFTQAILDYPLHSNGLIDVPKVLADIVESTMGAVFIDSNASVDTVWTVFKHLLEPIISPETLKLHPRSELFEVCQKKGLRVRFVDLWKEHTTFEVFVDDQFVGRSSYGLKKEIAQNRAAKVALENMAKILAQKTAIEDHGSTIDHAEKQIEEDASGVHGSALVIEKQIENDPEEQIEKSTNQNHRVVIDLEEQFEDKKGEHGYMIVEKQIEKDANEDPHSMIDIEKQIET